MFRHALQQQSSNRVVAAGQPQPGRQLLRAIEILAQAFRNGSPGYRNDALVTLVVCIVLDRDDHFPIAHQLLERGVVKFALPPGQPPEHQLVAALDHDHGQRTVALDLHGYLALELDGRSEQYGGGHGFAEDSSNGLRIIVTLQDRAPGLIEMHEFPADRAALKQELVQTVAR
ncbi:hypothetical protein MnTg04_00271 [bacterium MnTg04]|nr:hypothetical protein MnTg04_00271 [bacterium MnTg04]